MLNNHIDKKYYIEKRTVTRILAVQASYLMFFNKSYINKDNVDDLLSYLEEVKNILELNTPDIKFLLKILDSLINNFYSIDDKIKLCLHTNWSIDRLNLISLAIIKTATCELLAYGNIDRTIIVNEYVNIASQVLDNREVNFINAVLNKV